MCTPSVLLLSVLLVDLAFRSIGHLPLPWWEKQDALGFFSDLPTAAPPDSQDSHTAYGNSKVFCAMLWECSGCSLATDCSQCPKRGHCHGESQCWALTRCGKSHVDAKKLYWCHHLSKQTWNFTELRNRFCIFIGIKDDRWSKQRHPRARYMSMQKL